MESGKFSELVPQALPCLPKGSALEDILSLHQCRSFDLEAPGLNQAESNRCCFP